MDSPDDLFTRGLLNQRRGEFSQTWTSPDQVPSNGVHASPRDPTARLLAVLAP